MTTLAGSGNWVHIDGVGTDASFLNLCGLAVDAYDNVFLAENYVNNWIRLVSPAGKGISELCPLLSY